MMEFFETQRLGTHGQFVVAALTFVCFYGVLNPMHHRVKPFNSPGRTHAVSPLCAVFGVCKVYFARSPQSERCE